ncbi:Ger(x)C family spore germination protein [Clostridium sp. YIM B02505]|uniref:Ger(X)C family spore germination protein n=1 Tax=Clostridium yunnanense TaxID=2800325 RepID=A0ABS1EUJ3_9CLOT|nr:Ger(x)C family spore germination protein [Clostridium yunnanense]MBK1813046.1 Ger(x)C family spore germination protein [Clostridium yunnanense]
MLNKPIKIFVLLLYIFTSLSLVSCDYKDIDRRIFIVALGIDYNDTNSEELIFSFKAALTAGSSGKGSSEIGSGQDYHIYEVKADSLANAFREVKTLTSFEPDYSHMKIIVFGQKFAENYSINSIIDFFVRRRDFQVIAYSAVAFPNAKEVLSVSPSDEYLPGNALFMKFGQGSESPYKYTAKLFQMYDRLITPGSTPFCSVVEKKENDLYIKKVALFQDGKLKLILEQDEAKVLNILNNTSDPSSLRYNYRGASNPIGVGLNQTKTKIKFKEVTESRNIVFDINIKVAATLEEVGIQDFNTKDLENSINRYVEEKALALLEKLKENQVDPLQLQRLYWSKTPSYELSNKWLTKEYSKVQFNVNVSVTIERSGLLKMKQ